METGTVCYRHPDRETLLGCASCGQPICLECAIDTPVGQKCFECARPAARQVTARQLMNRPTPVAFSLIGISVVLFVVPRVAPGLADPTVRWARDLIEQYAAQANWLVADGEWWRVLTAAFLHGSSMHLLFNMWALYIFGPELERQVGSLTFATLYLATAAAGGAAAFYLSDEITLLVGASGAIFGLFGVWLIGSWRIRHTRAGAALYRQLLVLLGINAVFSFAVPRISWQGHLGGFVAGLLIGYLWGQIPTKTTSNRTSIAAAVGVLAIIAVIFG
jgi:membrane associated rhomboid family serine protease